MWMLKDSRLFDEAMGSFYCAEICKLVNNFLLFNLSEKYERKNLALNLNDGSVFKNVI